MKKLMKRTALPALIIALTASPVLCGNILIPGYETLHFKAGQVTQDVSFRNPEENICSFRMSLTLEDGTPVWIADDLLNPGEVFLKIDLEHAMTPGFYRNAKMKYECSAVKGGYRMNGAEIRVNIDVK